MMQTNTAKNRLNGAFMGLAAGAGSALGAVLGAIKPWFGPDATNSDLDHVRLLSAKCPAETRRAVARATSAIDLRPSFEIDGAQTLVVCGSDDAATPPKHSEQIAGAISNSSLEIVEGAGHMVIAEEPERIAQLILTATTAEQT